MNVNLHDFSYELKQKKIDYLSRMNSGYFSLFKSLFTVILILNSEVFWHWFNYTNGGNSTILHLYQNVFEKFSFPLPNLTTQIEICEFLDNEISTLDAAINKVKKIIELAESTKKSLIYEYVTGKKRVEV